MLSLILLQLSLTTITATADNPRWATEQDFKSPSFRLCRGYYDSVRNEPEGIGWWTDYPEADYHLSQRLRELTKLRVEEPVVVRLNSPLLMHCQFLLMEDVGTIGMSPGEQEGLKNYLVKGGFLWTDDSWGTAAWTHWLEQWRRVFPPFEFLMEDVPQDHAMFWGLYGIKGGIWQQPHVNFWLYNESKTSERGEDSEKVVMKMVLDKEDRIIAVMTHNTDIADGWEEDKIEYQDYLRAFGWKSYALGINIVLYALSH